MQKLKEQLCFQFKDMVDEFMQVLEREPKLKQMNIVDYMESGKGKQV